MSDLNEELRKYLEPEIGLRTDEQWIVMFESLWEIFISSYDAMDWAIEVVRDR